MYKYFVRTDANYVNGHFSNVVYHITCNKCKLQHVGKTCQNFNIRFSCHIYFFRNPRGYSSCKTLNNHCSRGYCKSSSYTANIIEKCISFRIIFIKIIIIIKVNFIKIYTKNTYFVSKNRGCTNIWIKKSISSLARTVSWNFLSILLVRNQSGINFNPVKQSSGKYINIK